MAPAAPDGAPPRWASDRVLLLNWDLYLGIRNPVGN